MDVFVLLLLSGFCVSTASFPNIYYFINKNMTWAEANVYCIKEHTGLAQITNPENNNAVKNTPTGGYTDKAWIGLYQVIEYLEQTSDAGKDDEGDNGEEEKGAKSVYSRWIWSETGQTSTFSNWEAGQPVSQNGNEACATIVVKDGTWTSEPCAAQYPFFCYEVYKSKKIVVSMNVQTDADLENPDNSAALMQQLQASLNKQGVTDFKLTWTKRPVRKSSKTVKDPC